MNIHDKKKSYLDKEIFNLISLIEVTSYVGIARMDFVSEDGEVIPLKLADNSMVITETDSNGEIVQKFCNGTECRSFNQENYKKFLKFIDNIYTVNDIRNSVGLEFIKKITFNYIIQTNLKGQAGLSFTNYLLEELQNAIKPFTIYFPLINLELFQTLEIGKVKISKLSPEFIQNLEGKDSLKNKQLFIKEYGNKLYASYTTTGDKIKATEKAYTECCIAIDILKICSETLENPKYKLSFDIDSRVTEPFTSQSLIVNTLSDNDFTINNSRIPNNHTIDQSHIENLNRRNFFVFQQFYISINSEKTELQKLILIGINKLAKAFTSQNLNQRIAEMFTILESLVIPNSQANILESLTKYVSKLSFKERIDRKNLITLLKTMYEVRSKFLHHAEEVKFEIYDLAKLQVITQNLLVVMIEKSLNHSSKNTILQEIDDAIIDAY